MNKAAWIFSTILFVFSLKLFNFSWTSIFLIYASIIILYLALQVKNRHIGLPSVVATFTILIILYLFGLVGNCHLCSTKKDGLIFFCNRLIDMAPLNYDQQLGDKNCIKELIWVWPPKQN
jgi:hypothetical protein